MKENEISKINMENYAITNLYNLNFHLLFRTSKAIYYHIKASDSI